LRCCLGPALLRLFGDDLHVEAPPFSDDNQALPEDHVTRQLRTSAGKLGNYRSFLLTFYLERTVTAGLNRIIAEDLDDAVPDARRCRSARYPSRRRCASLCAIDDHRS
jgi:hypothetical protein